MTKRPPEFDNRFTPGSQTEEGAAWGMIFVTIFAALVVAGIALARAMGAW